MHESETVYAVHLRSEYVYHGSSRSQIMSIHSYWQSINDPYGSRRYTDCVLKSFKYCSGTLTSRCADSPIDISSSILGLQDTLSYSTRKMSKIEGACNKGAVSSSSPSQTKDCKIVFLLQDNIFRILWTSLYYNL